MVSVEDVADSESQASREATRQHRFLLFVLVLGIVLLWLPALRSSFWVDETWTYWAIGDGFFEAIDRAQRFHSVSPTYFAVLWCVKRVCGSSEWVLRLPSVVAGVLTVFVLCRLAGRLTDRETGLLAGIVFVCSGPVAFAAADARPYAMVVLASTGAIYFLVEWVRERRARDAVAYAVLASLSVYLQVLSGAMFAVHAVYVWRARGAGLGQGLRGVNGLAVLVFILLLPLVPDAWSQLEAWVHVRQTGRPLWIGTPTVADLAVVCVPPVIAFSLLISILVVSAVTPSFALRWRVPKADGNLLLLSWAFMPPTLFFVISGISPVKLFVPRYVLCAAPGLSLLAACLMRAVEPPRARRIAVQIVVSLSVLSFFGTNHGAEDWRSAVNEARQYAAGKAIPVLLRSGIDVLDASDVDVILDPNRRDSILTPLAAYKLDADVIPLPWAVETEPQLRYMEQILSDRLLRADSFLLIARAFGDDGKMTSWLRGRLAPLGFCARSLGNFGAVHALVFERGAAACGNQGLKH